MARSKAPPTRAAGPSRRLHERVRTAKGRRLSSARWLERQRNDPYVQRAARDGFRSRAAYKLLEIDQRFCLLGRRRRVLDLGAAPGSWCQVCLRRGATAVVGVDLVAMSCLKGAALLQGDMRDPEIVAAARAALGGRPDVVLSDMAAPATGHRETDRLRVNMLAQAAAGVALAALRPGGAFVAKVMRSGAADTLLRDLRLRFARVRHFKPDASRPESDEIYVVAQELRGKADMQNGRS